MKKFNILFSLLLTAGFFMVSPSFSMAQGASPAQPPGQAMQSQTYANMNFQSFQVKDLLGKTIKDKSGKSIGKVSDVVIGKSGRADFVIISRGGFLSGDKYTPIPFETFMSNATNLASLQKDRALRTNLARADIDKAPTFASRHWKMTSEQTRVCNYFGPAQCNHM